MRRRKSAGSAAGSTSRVKSSFGLRLETTSAGAERLARLGDDADRAALLDDHLAHRASVRISTPRAAQHFAIACVIAPMPPMAWPQTPFLPFTSPKAWCSST